MTGIFVSVLIVLRTMQLNTTLCTSASYIVEYVVPRIIMVMNMWLLILQYSIACIYIGILQASCHV